MRPEWQRRAVATFLTVLSIAPIRKIEPAIAQATGLDGVWTTRVIAIAILIMCFKLADTIPDEQWRFSIWRPRAIHVVILAVGGLMLALFYGSAH
jgi:hypothetical protein